MRGGAKKILRGTLKGRKKYIIDISSYRCTNLCLLLISDFSSFRVGRKNFCRVKRGFDSEDIITEEGCDKNKFDDSLIPNSDPHFRCSCKFAFG